MNNMIHKIVALNKEGVELLSTGTNIPGMVEMGLALILLARKQANGEDRAIVIRMVQQFATEADSPLFLDERSNTDE